MNGAPPSEVATVTTRTENEVSVCLERIRIANYRVAELLKAIGSAEAELGRVQRLYDGAHSEQIRARSELDRLLSPDRDP